MSKISIIIPLYNTENYVEDCVNSILNQSGVETEIIIIDDNSNDKGPSKVKKLQEKYDNIVFINNINSKGVSGARNTGISKATGEYIVFLDSDDVLLDNSLTIRKEYLFSSKHKVVSADFVQFTNAPDIDNTGYFRGKLINHKLESQCYNTFILDDPIAFYLKYFCLIWTGTLMVNRDHLLSVGFFDENITHGEDEELWYRLCDGITVGFLSDKVAGYRMRDGSATTNVHKKYRGACELRLKQLKSLSLSRESTKLLKLKFINEFLTFQGYMRGQSNFMELLLFSLFSLRALPTSFAVWKALICSIVRIK